MRARRERGREVGVKLRGRGLLCACVGQEHGGGYGGISEREGGSVTC